MSLILSVFRINNFILMNAKKACKGFLRCTFTLGPLPETDSPGTNPVLVSSAPPQGRDCSLWRSKPLLSQRLLGLNLILLSTHPCGVLPCSLEPPCLVLRHHLPLPHSRSCRSAICLPPLKSPVHVSVLESPSIRGRIRRP